MGGALILEKLEYGVYLCKMNTRYAILNTGRG